MAPPAQRTAFAKAASRGIRGYEDIEDRNWAGNVIFRGSSALAPATLEELRATVRAAAPPIRVVGRGHSFTPVAECRGGTLLSLGRMNRVLDFRPPEGGRMGSIAVEGGITYTEIVQFLGKRGGLQNLPTIPQATVAGAIATGTHGSGLRIQNLATQVSEIEFVKADGSLAAYSRERTPEVLAGARTHLGCLGVLSRLVLDVVPYFDVHVVAYQETPIPAYLDGLPDLLVKVDSVSALLTFCPLPESPQAADTCMMVLRHFLPEGSGAKLPEYPERFYGGQLLKETQSMFYSGVCEKPSQFRVGRFTWSDGLSMTINAMEETAMVNRDMQAEFFVPLETARAALTAVGEVARTWGPQGLYLDEKGLVTWSGLLVAIEVRVVKGDSGWLSPHPVDSLCIHFSFDGDLRRLGEVMRASEAVENALRPFGPRAHWGKQAQLTFAPSRLAELYGEGLARFRALCREHDPEGRFLNDHVRRMLFPSAL